MNHDELLAKINSTNLYEYHLRNTLRAVVELHKPDAENKCEECNEMRGMNWVSYPCSTIQIIEKELK